MSLPAQVASYAMANATTNMLQGKVQKNVIKILLVKTLEWVKKTKLKLFELNACHISEIDGTVNGLSSFLYTTISTTKC